MSKKMMRAVAIATFLLRVFFWVKCSYLHPDEHLQGPQVVANEMYGWARQQVWDFDSDHAIRSHALLWLLYGFPMAQFSAQSNPQTVLYVVRAALALFTWALTDMAIDRLCRNRSGQMRALILTSTSYVTWVHQSHTLSNSLETVLVLWFLVIVQEFHTSPPETAIDRHVDSLLLALIAMLGIFNRPTFVAFLALPSIQLLRYFVSYPSAFVSFVFGLASIGALLVYLDTLLYGSSTWVVAPYNFVKYNINPNNLSAHGLHTRWLHIAVNLPLLLGPGLLYLRPSWSLPTLATVSGLGVLSLIPHQEARFLVALVPLLCIQMSFKNWPNKWRNIAMFSWVVFNLIFGVIFGVLHQGGVVPALSHLRTIEFPSQTTSVTVVWWRTYTPPLWLLGVEEDDLTYFTVDKGGVKGVKDQLNLYQHQSKLCVIDMMSESLEEVQDALVNAPRPLYIVAPIASHHDSLTKGSELIWHTWEHLTFENFNTSDMGSFQPGLGIWLFT